MLVVRVVLGLVLVLVVLVVRVVRVMVEVEAFDFERDLKLHNVFYSLCVGCLLVVVGMVLVMLVVGEVVIVKVEVAVNNAVVVDSLISSCSTFLIAVLT